ncbi:hypothetical protein ES705_41111 [subsurface metagenome]
MREHRIYYGRLHNDHYFVEVKKNLFDEWDIREVRNITHRDIVKWRLRERDRRARVMLVTLSYIKQGCKETTKLLKTIGRSEKG